MKRTLVTQATWAVFLAAGLLAGAGCSSQAKLKRYLDRAERYFGNERYSEAFVEYMNALRLDSTNRVAMRQIGLACFEMGDIQRAYPFLSKASELDPTNLNVRVKIGVIYLLAGQREKAREEAERVLGSSPDNLDGLVLLSDATSTVAGQKEVLKRLEACRGSLGAILRYQLALGNANLRVSQFDAAEKAYREAQRIDPKSPQPHQALGLLRRAQGDRAAAMAEYEKAAELSPPDSNARTQLAGIYLQEGRTNDAVRVLDEVARKKPDQASAQYMLAEIDFAQKRYDGYLK